MAVDIELVPINQLNTFTTINENFNKIEEAFQETLSRDGTIPNQLNADIDLNGSDVLNGGNGNFERIVVDGIEISPNPSGLSDGDKGDITVSGSGTVWTIDVMSAFGRSLVDDVDAATARSTLGLVIGTDVQAYDADLTTWAGKTAPSGTVVGTTDEQTLTNKTLTSPVINTPTGIVKGDVGLGNVDNTSDANKPISTATQTALDLKAPLASPTFTGLVTTAGQIAFPATANLSANANTLDDYEEGTTTPTPTAVSGTLTSASATLEYTKIGNRVFFSVTIGITTNGTGAGGINVALPFTANAEGSASGVETGVSGVAIVGRISSGSATLSAIVKFDGSYPGADGAVLKLIGHYRTAA